MGLHPDSSSDLPVWTACGSAQSLRRRPMFFRNLRRAVCGCFWRRLALGGGPTGQRETFCQRNGNPRRGDLSNRTSSCTLEKTQAIAVLRMGGQASRDIRGEHQRNETGDPVRRMRVSWEKKALSYGENLPRNCNQRHGGDRRRLDEGGFELLGRTPAADERSSRAISHKAFGGD